MSSAVDEDLYRRVSALLEPGEITLHGAVVHTEYGGDEESLLHQATLNAGDAIAEHTAEERTYVYSGNDDEDFGVNQHQGLTVEGDEFVWECQQLLRDGTFDLVIYWEAGEEIGPVLDAIEDALADTEGEYEVFGVTEDGLA
jgi:hypothetical protein